MAIKPTFVLSKLLVLAFLVTGVTNPLFSQVSDDNEDGVMKISAPSRRDYVPGQVLVKFKDANRIQVNRSRGKFSTTNVSLLSDVLRKHGVSEMEQLLPNEKPERQLSRSRAFNGEVIQEHDLSQLYQLKLSEEHTLEVPQLIEELSKLDEVEYAEPNYKVYTMAADPIASSFSSNPMVSQQWYLDDYGVKELWNKPVINSERPVIAIIDTGVDITHPDLKDNIWTKEGTDDEHGYDFINNTTKMRDNNSHGTHVAGIAAAANNGVGIVGANPKALIMPITVLQSNGSGDNATVIRGIEYAVTNGATVINMSLGTNANSNALREVLANAYQKAVLVAAAGNDGSCIYTSHYKKHKVGPCFPAAYSFVLGVQATHAGGGLAPFSNYDDDGPLTSCEATANAPDGFNYELKAPGTEILSTIPGGGYTLLDGTSMASPLVAGAISALMMVKHYDNQEILWGDLLHTNNIAEAYNVAARPAELDVMRIALRNRNEQAQYDEENDVILRYYEVNVGETLNIYPVVRSSFGKASNIKLKVDAPEGVEVIDGEVDFGFKLDAFGNMTSKNPLVIKIPDKMPNAAEIAVTIEATCDESNKTSSSSFSLRVCNMWTLKGLLTEDMTLTPDHVYYVSGNLGVAEGVTLTIEPGTRLEFAKDTGLYSFGKVVAHGTPSKNIIFTNHNIDERWSGISYTDNMSYFRLEGCYLTTQAGNGYIGLQLLDSKHSNCICTFYKSAQPWDNTIFSYSIGADGDFYNYVNNEEYLPETFYQTTVYPRMNFFNNFYANDNYMFKVYGANFETYEIKQPPYFGTSREDLLKPYILEFGNTDNAPLFWGETYATLDLSNMQKEPYKEAHGIVWKVLVNGKDAQDEKEALLPLGVGKHKFEVYFNRPMNKEVIPQISFGVVTPYTKQPVTEDGSWNTEGTIYTAYKTITGKTQSDGMNRIHVHGAEDNEYFPCPYEATRFNIMVQAAGSMATGFQANAGLGCVNLKWNNENNDFEDAMGFNVYRYTQGENGINDTIRINEAILDLSATSYIDDSVTPGETYYYYYKVLSTALQEYDVSNVVAVTPLTATRGDANGSGSVDVADVVTTVNYVTGLQPKPFVFDAADMNSDKLIDIFDVVGIIRGILNPTLLAATTEEATAIYTVEDGVLYVESSTSLAGVQVQLAFGEDSSMKHAEFTTAQDLEGFETASAWLSANDYLFLAYSMNDEKLSPGRHALLYVGDADITSLRLSDMMGRNVTVVAGDGNETTDVGRLGKAMSAPGVYDLYGRKITHSQPAGSKLPHGVYIIDGKKVVK